MEAQGFQTETMLLLNSLLFPVLLLDDSSESQGGKSHNSSEVKFTGPGGFQRWDDDDTYPCADEVSRLCPEIPIGNNFALLVCLQEKAKVHFITIN